MGTVPSYSDMLNMVVMEESHLLEVRWLFSIMLPDYPITVAAICIWGVSKQRDISQQPLVTASYKINWLLYLYNIIHFLPSRTCLRILAIEKFVQG